MPASLIIDRFYSYVKSQQIEKFFGPLEKDPVSSLGWVFGPGSWILSTGSDGILPDDSFYFNPLSANPIKWSDIFKQFVGNSVLPCVTCVWPFCGIGA